MIYADSQSWRNARHKRVLFFGMSGLGKTHVSRLLHASNEWFHYSIDYRIGTRYLGESISDNLKREAMKVPFLRELLRSNSIYLGSNLSFENLSLVSSYVGKPGNASLGGLSFAEYTRRQEQFRRAEVAALLDTGPFIERAASLYQMPHFICDTGGSICEWVNPEDPADPVLSELASQTLMIWIEGSAAHTAELIARFDQAPKPMAYQPQFLARVWGEYLAWKGLSESQVDPDDFIRWTYAQALSHRQPRYAAMARSWGLTVKAEELWQVRNATEFEALVARLLDQRAPVAGP
jgi:hypothetical protein